MMKSNYYTTGQIANLTGVSYKTIRYYIEKGLLKPETQSASGYRLFGQKSIEVLQRILMLKYLNFPINEIKNMLSQENGSESFHRQQILLETQLKHLKQVLDAVKKIQSMDETRRWENILKIIRLTQQKEEIEKQYQKSDNLQKRINIHMYSTAKVNWYEWILNGLELREGMKILDIGCGNAMLWISMAEKLPNDLHLFLSDHSEGMLLAAKKGMETWDKVWKEKNIHITYLQKDAEYFQMEEALFDRVIANHMLYHVSNENRLNFLKTCKKLLKADGMFFASTVGRTHLRELYKLVEEFDPTIQFPTWMSANFELENGGAQLEQVFSHVFVEEQENDLLVPDPQAIYDYVESLPGNAKEVLQLHGQEFLHFLKNRVSEQKPYFIHKSTGAFRAYK